MTQDVCEITLFCLLVYFKADMCPMVSCDHSKAYEPPTIYFQLETYACPRHLSKGGMDNNIRYKLRIIF